MHTKNCFAGSDAQPRSVSSWWDQDLWSCYLGIFVLDLVLYWLIMVLWSCQGRSSSWPCICFPRRLARLQDQYCKTKMIFDNTISSTVILWKKRIGNGLWQYNWAMVVRSFKVATELVTQTNGHLYVMKMAQNESLAYQKKFFPERSCYWIKNYALNIQTAELA